MKSTFLAKKEGESKRWYLLNLEGLVLGRAATRIADILRGKNKPVFTPHADAGDFVVAINASHIRLTGNKKDQKRYYWYSGYPGGIKSVSAARLLATKPDQLVRLAVRGMLPKNRLSRSLLRKLKIYGDSNHPHAAQKPEELK